MRAGDDLADVPLPELLGGSLLQILVSAGLLWWMTARYVRARGTPAAPPTWTPQLAFLALATFLLCTLTVPALVVRLLGAPGEEPSAALGLFTTAVANVVVLAIVLAVARRRFDASPAQVALARPSGLALAYGVFALVAGVPALLGVSTLNLRLIEALGLEPQQALVETLFDDAELLSRPWVIVSIVLVVPFCEELLFRGLLQRALRVAMPAAPAILASSFLFAIVHDPQSILPVLTVGAVLGLIVEATDSVWAATAAHALFNAANLAAIAAGEGG